LKTDGIDKALKRAVDLDQYLRLEEVGEILFIEDITYNYRQHQSNISTKGDFKGIYWHSLVIKNACDRRGLKPDEVVNDMLIKYIPYYFHNYFDHLEEKPKTGIWSRLFDRLKRKCKKIFQKIFWFR
jgi:hypothetical protein